MNANGIHHVTAIAGSARRNVELYTRTLGLRLVKKTVNFDDPKTYHLYYGDETGRPGTILTFFPWEHVAPARFGSGETSRTTFRVPEGSLGFWAHRLLEAGLPHDTIERRFDASVLPFRDRDGMRLGLVGVPGIEAEPAWSDGGVPAEHAIRGFHGVALRLRDVGSSGAILSDVFGFAEVGREGSVVRFRADGTAMGAIVDIVVDPAAGSARLGGGSVHHVAFRAADDEAAFAMRRQLAEHHGIETTEQKDRNYFRSLYFREPGGVLFEIATDEPGFAADEPVTGLGLDLKLPAQFETRRQEIEDALPSLVA